MTSASPVVGSAHVKRRHVGGGSARLGLAAIIILVAALVQLQAGNFISSNNIASILVNVSSLLIAGIAAGRLLVTGNVDLSIGGQFGLLAVVTAVVARDTQSPWIPVVAALIGGGIIGLVNGILVRLLSISPLIVTLGLSFVYTGLAYALSNSRSVFGFNPDFTRLGRDTLVGVPVPVWIALAVFIVGALALTKTVSGVRAFAIGGSPEAARRAGIDVDKTMVLNFVYMGVSMGLVAALATARLGSGTPGIGIGFELNVLTAVIVGGIAFTGGSGRPLGILLGVVLLGTISAAMVFLGLSDFFQQIAKGVILLLALGADQYGQARSARRRKPKRVDSSAMETEAPAALAELHLAVRERQPQHHEVALRAVGLGKSYGPVVAVEGVSFELYSGMVTCLVGDNGAGKSSLIKMLAGAVEPSSGTVEIVGEQEHHSGASRSRSRAIETVWQDLAIAPNLGAVYNLVLGKEPSKYGWLRVFDSKRAEEQTLDRLDSISVHLDDVYRPLADLSGGQRQSVAIARVVEPGVKVVILDEPTAALGVGQTRNVLDLIQRLASSGVAVLLVSHDVEVVSEIADRIVVMRRGRLVTDAPAGEVSTSQLVQLMAGFAAPASHAESDAAHTS